jgi:hypothetical protein
LFSIFRTFVTSVPILYLNFLFSPLLFLLFVAPFFCYYYSLLVYSIGLWLPFVLELSSISILLSDRNSFHLFCINRRCHFFPSNGQLFADCRACPSHHQELYYEVPSLWHEARIFLSNSSVGLSNSLSFRVRCGLRWISSSRIFTGSTHPIISLSSVS